MSPRIATKTSVPDTASTEEAKSVEAAVEDTTAAAEEGDTSMSETAEKPAKRPYKKRAAKQTEKPEKPELVPEIHLEFQGKEVLESDLLDRIKAVFVADGHRASSIKSLQVYVKPEDFKAYFVINDGKFKGAVDLF